MRRMHRTGEGPRSREARGPVPASRTAGREARPAATRATGSGRRRPSCGRNAPPLRLVSAGALACSVLLAGCGGGGSGTGIPGATPAPGTATYHEVTGPRRPGGYTFSGRLGDAVRIGIEDSPVDFTHPVFHGRVQLEGAAFAYWRPLASQPTQQAFASCAANDPCPVFLVDSGGDPARLQDLARTVLEHAGLPAAGDRWFLHDRAGGSAGWYELPAAEDFAHGTVVALVAAGRRFHPFPRPDPVIVPMALNFDEQLEGQHYFSDRIAASNRDPDLLAELDREHAAKLRRQHQNTDIINASNGVSVDLNSIGGKNLLRIWLEDHRLLRCGGDPLQSLPPDCGPPARPDETTLTWAEFAQLETPASERTIRVWAAGNHAPGTGLPPSVPSRAPYGEFPNVLAGDGHRNLDSLGPFHFPELRGEHIRVTALSADEQRLAPYADPCGALPDDWDTAEHGKHYCLAAPGTLTEGVEGTSFAAPFVSGMLARMITAFPGVPPRELVAKLMDTADGYGEDGFDGDLYVGEVVNALEGTVTVESPAILPGIVRVDVDFAHLVPGGYVVVQRGCSVGPAGYPVATGEVGDLCVVWGTPDGTQDEAGEKARERFRFLYGAGRVDVDADDGAFAPMSDPLVSADGGTPAPLDATRLRAPAAWGSLNDRLSGLSLAAFDALDFPFFYPLEEFVSNADAGGLSPIPEFLPEPGDLRTCDPLRQLAPGLLCIPWASEAQGQALVSPHGAGAAFRLGEGTRVSGFTRQDGRLDGAGSGAFSFGGGSSFVALNLDRGWAPARSDRWRLDGSLTLAVDLPRGLDAPHPSIFRAGTTLLSEWSVGVTHSAGRGRTRLSLAQPPRAEAGRGRFTLPSGRREDGTRVYETHRVSLVPSGRELTLRLSHQRPLLGGDLVLSAHRTENRGHRPAHPEHGAGLAYRAKW